MPALCGPLSKRDIHENERKKMKSNSYERKPTTERSNAERMNRLGRPPFFATLVFAEKIESHRPKVLVMLRNQNLNPSNARIRQIWKARLR